MKNLIINADDFGMTPGISRGILDAHFYGVVTSTSAMMNSPHISESLAAARKETPKLGVGVHLVLTWGKPLLPVDSVPTLVDAAGHFHKIHQLPGNADNFKIDEVHAEWGAQIEAFIAAGCMPDHLDSHHHSSYSNPKLFKVMLELAQKYDLPIRLPSRPEGRSLAIEPYVQIMGQHTIRYPLSCITAFYSEGVSIANLSRIISEVPQGISELMCHPGYVDSELKEGSSYTTAREAELRILTSKDIKACIQEYEVSLARFSDL